MGFLSSIGKTIGKVAGIASDVAGIGGAFGFSPATGDAQDFASAQAAASRGFTKEQLQNRHQWEVADLRAAGLNPILSAMKGAPSIGGSASATSNANAAQDAAATVSSASQAKQQKLNEQKVQAEIQLLKSQASNQTSQARNTGNIGNVTQNVGNLMAGLHALSSNTGKAVSAVTDGKPPPSRNWKRFPKNGSRADYLKYMKQKGY